MILGALIIGASMIMSAVLIAMALNDINKTMNFTNNNLGDIHKDLRYYLSKVLRSSIEKRDK